MSIVIWASGNLLTSEKVALNLTKTIWTHFYSQINAVHCVKRRTFRV